ncbi:MAG: DUF934 domain-containing protein [Chitinivorax sp.]|mgnify:FL=1
MHLIKEWQRVSDDWQMLAGDDAALVDCSAGGPRQILPLALYASFAPALHGQRQRIGLLLEADANPEQVDAFLAQVALVAVRFDSFSDGRGYSLGRLIRQRYGFCGELRAVGDVLRDQLYFLYRCGFDAFLLRQDQDPDEALKGASDYRWQPLSGLMAAGAAQDAHDVAR